MDVVTVGHASLDRIKTGSTGNIQLGGAAVYSAMAAKIFSNTGIVSRVGRDFPTEFYSLLRKAGIDTFGLKKVLGKSTSFFIKYDKDGAAKYNSYELNVGIHIRPEDIPRNYLHAKAFHLAPTAASKQKIFLEFLRKNSSALVSLNTHIGYFLKYKKEIAELISEVDVFTINDEEAMRLTETRSLEHSLNVLKRMKHKLIIVTMGVYGSIVIERGEITFFPSVYQPKIVDLTGCGDAFAGSFISSYLKTKDALKSANIANSVASIVATDWNFQAIENLKFESLEKFQEFVVSRQRRLGKMQRSMEYFFQNY
ncbi:MAG: carbohydrate kinase family protein [Methanobacteriota archaeon]